MYAPAGSVIIPVLDEAETVTAFLQNLRLRVGNDWQILVVDGGSRDQTAALAAPFCDQVLHAAASRSLQMNCGARHATGNILLFLHADTTLPEDFAGQMQQFMQSGKFWGRFDVVLDDPRRIFRLIAWMINWRSRITGIATGDQALFMRQSLFVSLNGFREIPLMEDIDFCKRARRWLLPFCSRSRVITSARKWQQAGVIKTIVLMWWLRLAFFVGISPSRLHRWYYAKP